MEAVGGIGCALIVTVAGIELQPAADFAVTEQVPVVRPAKTPFVFVTAGTNGFVPVTVYEIPVPVGGAVTVIVPVATAHVGCTNVVDGGVLTI